MTHSTTWKKFEARVARMFGCRRQILSGSSGRDDAPTCSDSTHPALFIEAKYRERHAVRTLYDATSSLAKKERRTPVLALADKGKPGFLLVIHTDHLPRVFAEYAAALPREEADELEGMMRMAWTRLREAIPQDSDQG